MFIVLKPKSGSRARLRLRISRGSLAYDEPSGLRISANMQIAREPPTRNGTTCAVEAMGNATMSLSWIRWYPSIDDPSNPIPSSNAPSSSAGAMANDFMNPRMSVNQSRIEVTPCSLQNFTTSAGDLRSRPFRHSISAT